MLRKLFIEHPREVGENYAEHFGVASRFGLELMAAGLCCFVHALIPGFCQTTGSKTVRRLHSELVSKRARQRDIILAERVGDWVI
jgi:hypothetical protein